MIISIVTPTLNAGGTIRDTLESVRPQLRDDIEHLLLDAGSTDQTLEVAKGYPHLIVSSEPDRSIYDGMNKGVELARGEWLLFLQGDDWLPDGTLDAYRQAIVKYPMAEVICGSAEAVKQSKGKQVPVWSVTDALSKRLTTENIALKEPMINARLFKKSVFDSLGYFSLDYALASDRDFLLKVVEKEIIQYEIDIMTYRYRWHSGSSTLTEGNAITSKLSAENLAIAKVHLKRNYAKSMTALSKWYSLLIVQSAMNALEEFRWKDIINNCEEGMKKDKFWIFLFLKEILCAFPGLIARGGKSRSQLLKIKASVPIAPAR